MNDTIVPAGNTLRWLALGDSYTIGEAVSEPERFPNQAIRLLQRRGIQLAYPARMVATTGWTTQNLLEGLAAANLAAGASYDAVSLLIGVNNQYQGRDTAEYRIQFTECLQKAIALSGYRKDRVFVLSIPDWGVTPFGTSLNPPQIAAAIDRFNAINLEITRQAGVAYIDITPVSRRNDPTLVASDGLHPSGKQYGEWAELLVPVMEPRLR